MPYLLASIIAIVSAMVILFTRYEADDSLIKAEIQSMKNMYSLIDNYVNVYIQAGGNLADINFQELDNSGILPSNIEKFSFDTVSPIVPTKESKISFIKSNIKWQLLSTDNSSYKLLIDMTKNTVLMSKAIFSESFTGREFCEKLLFGDFVDADGFKSDFSDFTDSGSDSDGIYGCTIYK